METIGSGEENADRAFCGGAAQELIEAAEVRERDVDSRRGGLFRRDLALSRLVASIAASDRVRWITASALWR